ncbi:hypothetical protein LJC08_01880 [Methanimicrococcus sp. OttesenSCG-928-J09]|nr:hypothetical protein [Methanimicrococcus sp. OttesenSCG-928-J09]
MNTFEKRSGIGIKSTVLIMLCLFLAAAAFGCLGAKAYTIEGKIMMEDGSQPFADAKIYIELVDITDPKNQSTMEQLILENGSKENYTYTMIHHNVLDPKGIYTVTAFADMDGSETLSAGDYISKSPFRLEPNMIEQPFDIYMYPYNGTE